VGFQSSIKLSLNQQHVSLVGEIFPVSLLLMVPVSTAENILTAKAYARCIPSPHPNYLQVPTSRVEYGGSRGLIYQSAADA